jgi:hypothetical protein
MCIISLLPAEIFKAYFLGLWQQSKLLDVPSSEHREDALDLLKARWESRIQISFQACVKTIQVESRVEHPEQVNIVDGVKN